MVGENEADRQIILPAAFFHTKEYLLAVLVDMLCDYHPTQ